MKPLLNGGRGPTLADRGPRVWFLGEWEIFPLEERRLQILFIAPESKGGCEPQYTVNQTHRERNASVKVRSQSGSRRPEYESKYNAESRKVNAADPLDAFH